MYVLYLFGRSVDLFVYINLIDLFYPGFQPPLNSKLYIKTDDHSVIIEIRPDIKTKAIINHQFHPPNCAQDVSPPIQPRSSPPHSRLLLLLPLRHPRHLRIQSRRHHCHNPRSREETFSSNDPPLSLGHHLLLWHLGHRRSYSLARCICPHNSTPRPRANPRDNTFRSSHRARIR